jgi:hypothetical protein
MIFEEVIKYFWFSQRPKHKARAIRQEKMLCHCVVIKRRHFTYYLRERRERWPETIGKQIGSLVCHS